MNFNRVNRVASTPIDATVTYVHRRGVDFKFPRRRPRDDRRQRLLCEADQQGNEKRREERE